MVQQIDYGQAGVQFDMPMPIPVDATTAHLPTSNTAAVVTIAADSARGTILNQIHCSYTGAPTGGSITVENGSGTTVWKQYLSGAGPHEFSFIPPLIGSSNTALIVTLAAGGSGVSGALCVNAHKLL